MAIFSWSDNVPIAGQIQQAGKKLVFGDLVRQSERLDTAIREVRVSATRLRTGFPDARKCNLGVCLMVIWDAQSRSVSSTAF